MALTRDALVDYLQNKQGIDPDTIESDDAELFSSGLIDSFSMVDLIQFIEDEGGFKMSPSDVNLDNLDSIAKILAFAESQAV
ncbi:MAG: acyl carrier protein [Phycisphaeraceae bacterium]